MLILGKHIQGENKLKVKIPKLISLTLVLVLLFNTLYSKVNCQDDFITIYTMVFHPGPSVDQTKLIEWDFNGDGVVDSNQVDGSYVFPGPGNYTVKLKVGNTGNQTITSKTITISESLPTTTTPTPVPTIPSNWMNAAWTNRIKITIKAGKVTGDLTDFPVYLNLALLPSEFFTKVKTTGADIRITKADGKTELAREVASIDSTTKVGELYFKADLLKATTDNEFYIYFGNTTATEPGGETVWTNGYAGVWHLNNDPSITGPQILDSTSNKNHGTSAGAMTNTDSVPGKICKSLDFDGVNDFIDFGAGSSLNITNNLTVTIWVNGASTNQKDILGKRVAANTATSWGANTDTNVVAPGGHDWYVSGAAASSSTTSKIYRGGLVWDNTWRQTGFTFSSGVFKIYNNGIDITESSLIQKPWNPTVTSLYSTTASLKLGSITTNLSPVFKADELRISNVARTPIWLLAEYSNQNDNAGFFAIGTNETTTTPTTPAPTVPSNWMNTAWTNRVKITIKAVKVGGDLTDFPVYLNLALLPSEFFTKVKTTGADIRITKADGKTELAREVVSIDLTTKTGELHFKADSLKATSDNEFYIYFGNPAAAEIGGQNVWTNYVAVYHLTQDPSIGSYPITDSTSGTYQMTASGNLTSADSVTGKIGKGVDLDYTESDKLQNTNMPATANQGTVTYWCNLKDSAARYTIVSIGTGSSGTSYRSILYDKLSFIQNGAGGAGKSITAPSTNTWFYYAGRYNRLSTPNLMLTLNNSNYTGTATLGTSITNGISVGAGEWNVGATLDEIRYSNQLLTDNYLLTEYNNQNDNASFFTLSAIENITPTPTTPAPTVPSNWMNQSWLNRTKITIKAAKVAENLTDFPVYVNLADLGDSLFTKVNAGCGDIRVTDSSGKTELAREIVSCNSTSKTGELYFKASALSATTDNVFYIYYGNTAATNYDNTATYGRNKVWTSDFEIVAHFEENPDTATFVNSTGGIGGTYTNLAGLMTGSGQIGNSLDCNEPGAVGFVDLQDFSTNPHRNFAFSTFVRFDSLATPQVFFEYAAPGGLNTRRVAAMFNPGKINWNHNNANGNILIDTSLTASTWYHMSVNSSEENATNAKVSTWLNGANNTVKTGYDSANITANLGMICANRKGEESFNGRVDELRFYKAFKSNAWMLAEDTNLRSATSFYELSTRESL